MRAKSLALLVLALGCGLVASIGITQVMAKRDTDQSAAGGDTQHIFVATKTIPPGDLLSLDVVEPLSWPKDRIPPGAIGDIKDIDGRKCKTRLYKGEPILEEKLGDREDPSELVPPGYRVATVRVDAVSSGGGLIRPGDRVDLLVHMVRNPSKGILATTTRTFLQNIKVFAVNDVFDLDLTDDEGGSMIAKTVSLLVTPAQAQEVMFAGELGKIQLVMRNSGDDDSGAIPEIAIENLFPRDEDASAERKKGLQDFLNSMTKSPEETSTGRTSTKDTHTMRIIDGEEVHDVLLSPIHNRDHWTRREKTTSDQTPTLERDETAADDADSDDD